ncbi:MAG: glycosyltransferase family 39 protein, partial [Planctomycetia bacterium]|nr:glycosyltransferase family 39 protein [Planctomycetia bacterium]
AWFVSCSPMFVFAFEANVDSIFVAGYLLAVYFLARYALGDDDTAALALGSLAAGLAIGTKAPGVVFVPPLLALGAASAIRRGRGWGGKAIGLGVVVLAPASVSGFWWVRNALLTGNPLYPLHLVISGRVWLSGWYGPDVMRLSPYYIPAGDWRAMVDVILGLIDPRLAPVWLASLAGVWAVGARVRRPEDRWVGLVSALAVLNVALYWLLIPYRTQQRFLFHAVGLLAVPLARTFDRAGWLRATGVGLLVVHLLTRQSWPFAEGEPPWDLDPRVPNHLTGLIHALPTDPAALQAVVTQPWRLVAVALSAAVGLGALGAVRAWARASEKPSAASWSKGLFAAAALAGYAVLLQNRLGDTPRDRFFPRFPDAYRGWLALDHLAGPGGTRVAYAGTGLPYYLLGVGLRNEVRYVNVDAHPGWLLHDYHRAAGAGRSRAVTWDAPRPGWDRIHPDYAAWLANLRSDGIRLLVVTRANRDEGAHNVVTPDGFPVERLWADAHPETFEPVYGPDDRDPLFRIYRVDPDPRRTGLEKINRNSARIAPRGLTHKE